MFIADKDEELWEVLDEKGISTGKFEKRDIVHNNQLFHNEIALWIVDKQNKEVLVQRRSKYKKHNPGKLALCAGHVVGGETIMQALEKEAFEEIVIAISTYKVIELTKAKKLEKNNYHFSYHFCVLNRIPMEDMRIQSEELSEVFYIDYEKLKTMIKDSNPEVAVEWTDDVADLFHALDKIMYS